MLVRELVVRGRWCRGWGQAAVTAAAAAAEGGSWGGAWRGRGAREERGGLRFLEGQLDVDEGGEGLDGAVVLRVLKKVADAGLEVGVPVEDVELTVEEGLWFSVRYLARGLMAIPVCGLLRPRCRPLGGVYVPVLLRKGGHMDEPPPWFLARAPIDARLSRSRVLVRLLLTD